MENNKLSKKERDETRKSLDDLLNLDTKEDLSSPDSEVQKVLPEKVKTDYTKVRNDTADKAKKVLDKMLRFYLSQEIIEEDEYVQSRIEIEKWTLSKLMNVLETSEMAMTKMLERIDDGEMHPRMFEVLSNLQKNILDIVKAQTLQLIASEETIKKLSRDVDVFKPEFSQKRPTENTATKTQQGLSVRGTRDLMKNLQESNKNEPIENISFEAEKAVKIPLPSEIEKKNDKEISNEEMTYSNPDIDEYNSPDDLDIDNEIDENLD